jgi:hypothetical protein
MILSASWASDAGQSLIDALSVVVGLNTLPALLIDGKPSAPVIERFGLHT